MQVAVPDDREDVAAVAAQVGGDDPEREVRGEGGIHRVATPCECLDSGDAREVVRSRDRGAREPVSTSHGRAA